MSRGLDDDFADEGWGYADGDDLDWRREAGFRDPGGESALRAGLRDQPCPTCGEENALTAADVRRGYQCDRCSEREEGLGW